MRARLLFPVTFLALLFCGCASGIKVQTDYDPSADFSGIQTFNVLKAAGSSDMDSFTESRVKSAIVTVMQAKGFRLNSSNADVSVGFHASTTQETTLQTVSTGGWGGYGWRGGGMSTSTTTAQNYDVGTLVIAIANSSGNMIFQGSGSKTLSSGNVAPDEAQQNINEAVAKILADFPPGG
jgi:multidrug efflux pump subunit AcrB